MSYHKKNTDENSHSSNGFAHGSEYIKDAQKLSKSLNPTLQGYLAIAGGTFLFLFSLGFFMFFKLAIGFIGLGLIAWGLHVTGLIATLTRWFQSFTKRS